MYRVSGGKSSSCPVDLAAVCVLTGFYCLSRLLHLAIIHEAKDYVRAMIDLCRNTDFLNMQNDQRQVRQEDSRKNLDFCRFHLHLILLA